MSTRACVLKCGEGRVPQQAKAPLPMSHLLGQLSNVVAVSKATDVPKWVRYLHTHMPIGNERMSILLQPAPLLSHTHNHNQPHKQRAHQPTHLHILLQHGVLLVIHSEVAPHTHDNNSQRSYHVHNIHRGSLPNHTGPPHAETRRRQAAVAAPTITRIATICQ